MSLVWGIALSLGFSGCAIEEPGSAGASGHTASAVVALSSIPGSVRCIEVTGRQGAIVVSARANLANQTQAVVNLAGLPLGEVTFSALAWNRGCGNVTDAVLPTWQTGPVPAVLQVDRVPTVELTLYPIRPAEVEANFQPDFVEMRQCGLALIGVDSNSGFYATGLAEVATPVTALPATTQKVACGPYHACSIDAAGTVGCWGVNLRAINSPDPIVSAPVSPGAFQAVDIAVGHAVACAILVDGNITCWGNNIGGIVDPTNPGDGYVGPTTPPGAQSVSGFIHYTDITIGSEHACALRSDGAILCWGINDQGALGDDTATVSNELYPASYFLYGVVDIEASEQGMYALRDNGELYRWGENLNAPELVPNLVDVVDVAAGWYSACVLRKTGEVSCWGSGLSGELGDGRGQSTDAIGLPVDFSGAFEGEVPEIVEIDARFTSYCALHIDGQVSCWGDNVAGQLGDGTTTLAYSAVLAERWDQRKPYPNVIPDPTMPVTP